MAKTIEDVKELLGKTYPEYGKAFHDYFETRREELISVPWVSHDTKMHRKCQLGASIIQDEILNEFGFKKISRVLEKD